MYSYETARTSSFCNLLSNDTYPSDLFISYSSVSNFLAEVTFSKSIVFERLNWLIKISSTRSRLLKLLLELILSNNKFELLSAGFEFPNPIFGLLGFKILFPSAKSVNATKFLNDSELFVLFKIYTSTLLTFIPELTSGRDFNHLS